MLSGRRIVVVAPHPDDETIGAWGLIRRARRQGAVVHVIVVSDGGASHPGSTRWPRSRLIKERQKETRRALRGCHLTPSDLTFLGLPDGGLSADNPIMARTLATWLRRCRPELIIGPALNDDHADHSAVAEMLTRMRISRARKIAYSVWPLRGIRARIIGSLSLTVAEMNMKRRCLRGYRTQMGLITDAKDGFTMTHRHLAAFAQPRENFSWL